MTSSITAQGDLLAVRTPYAPDLVAALKLKVPATDRKWDAPTKTWLVHPLYGGTVQALIMQFLGEQVTVPQVNTAAAAAPVVRLLELRYLGRAKLREDGSETAFGWVNGGWNAIFPAAVLKAWFGQAQRPEEAGTLYGVLNVPASALPADIKAAYRRLARQWHPDVSKEPDTAEIFRRIKAAYDVFGDEGKRARYDAGRALEATLRANKALGADFDAIGLSAPTEWAAPLRCGYVMARGVEKLGRFVATEILAWEDIVRADGAVLVSSWPVDAKMFTEAWVL